MSEPKQIYTCQKCGAQFSKWFGQCPECGAWGTIIKQTYTPLESVSPKTEKNAKILSQIKKENFPRLSTGIPSFDQVLGGGIVPGSLILLAGQPGIGKSTLILQLAGNLKRPVLYVSGEESAGQVKIRADRLKIDQNYIRFLASQDISEIIHLTQNIKPSLLIVDSIQAVSSGENFSSAGSINQVRLSTAQLLQLAKSTNIPIFIIGHITKEGLVAGPKTLEHLVDAVLYLEGDPYHYFRLLRVSKNRFGPTQEIGVFVMESNGLKEVKNPSGAFLNENRENSAGSIVGAVLEGTKVFLAEIQALINPSPYPYPQRKVKGLDLNRAELLIAVLSRRAGIRLSHKDIYLNVVGGLKINESGVDLPVCLAITGASKNKKSPSDLVAFGEVGLDGQVRPCSFAKERIKTAAKLGFKKIILPQSKEKLCFGNLEIIEVKNLSEAIDKI